METFLLYSNILLWVMQAFVLFALFLLFRQFGEVFLKSGEGISRDGIALGDSIPEFSGLDLKSGEVTTRIETVQRPSVIVFVSPSCRPCQDLLSDWNELYERYADEFDFIVIVIGEENKAKRMLASKLIKGQWILDQDQHVFKLFQVRVTPFGFVVDGDGIVRSKGLCGGREHVEGLITFSKKGEEE